MAKERESKIKMGMFLMVMGGGLLMTALRRLKKSRKLEDLPQIGIASAPQGLVELSGFAWPDSLQHSLEGRPLAFASWRLEQHVSRGKSSYWKLIKAGALGEGFLLHDESGAAWIKALGADCEGASKITEWRKMSVEARSTFLKWLGGPVDHFPSGDSIFSTRFRVCLYEIPMGCPVVAQGNFSTFRKESRRVLPGLSVFKERYLKLKKTPSYSLALLDVNSDGRVDEDEFRLGNAQAAEMSARKVANGASVAVVESVEVLGHLIGSESNKLMLANTTENFLMDKLKKWNGTMIVGGALLVAAGVCILASEFTDFLNCFR